MKDTGGYLPSTQKRNVTWSGKTLETCEHPVYLGVTLDRTLSFKNHVKKTKSKICSRNYILSNLIGTTWGAEQQTLKPTALTLCYSAAKHECPVWKKSTHAKKIDPAPNACCCQITGCLRPTPPYMLHILAGITQPDIRRRVASMKERKKQCSTYLNVLYILEQTCTVGDLAACNDTAYKCVQHWLNRIWCFVEHDKKKMSPLIKQIKTNKKMQNKAKSIKQDIKIRTSLCIFATIQINWVQKICLNVVSLVLVLFLSFHFIQYSTSKSCNR